ncbi:MAG: hypothetical protein V4747_13985 [Pseudomonadota bacterium]
MPLYLIHRTRDEQRNPFGAHAALVDAANSTAAIAAANALVRGANGIFEGFAVSQVATEAGAAHVNTYFEGDAVNLLGFSRGGAPA